MSLRLTAAVVAAFVAGCAPSADLATPADLSTAPLAVDYALPVVTPPRLPAALRTGLTPATAMPIDHGSMDHEAMDHAAMGHAMSGAPLTATLRPEALAPAVEAYLALRRGLADDRLDAARRAAAGFAAGLPAAVGVELQDHSAEADAATDLAGLRAAFGQLSPPFIALVERVGLPPGVELSAFRCGMADAPEGGVWLQATGDLANPYFGNAMRTCGRSTGTIGHRPHEATSHKAGMQHD